LYELGEHGRSGGVEEFRSGGGMFFTSKVRCGVGFCKLPQREYTLPDQSIMP
jgi:hypothetical protein